MTAILLPSSSSLFSSCPCKSWFGKRIGLYGFSITSLYLCAATVNPSLWRQSQLLSTTGLFQVTNRIYQVRGYTISVITFIEGESGVIVVDSLLSVETARATAALYFAHRPRKPVVAVIYTHSHIDHYGGVKGVVNQEDVRAGKVRIFAPEGFTEEALSETLLAGNVMTRRASYMFGRLLPRGPQAMVGNGLDLTLSGGQLSLILPTDTITGREDSRTIDGLRPGMVSM